MIIKSYEIDKIKKSQCNLFLFYGSNEGFKKEIIKTCFLENFKGICDKYDEKEFLENENTILSSLLNKSFFEDEKILIISRVTDKIIHVVKTILNKKISEIKLIFLADKLDKKSNLRNLFEKNEKSICIPFYEDDLKTLFNIASEFFKKYSISVSSETINLIIDRCSGDRAFLMKELQKLFYLSKNNKKLDINDVNKITNLSENYSVSVLVDSCLSKNNLRTSKMLNENIYSLEDCLLIIRTFLNKSIRILNIRKAYDDSKNIDDEIRKYKPLIFWKDKEIVKKQTLNWSASDIQRLIQQINNTELLVKTNAENSISILYDFILNTSKRINN